MPEAEDSHTERHTDSHTDGESADCREAVEKLYSFLDGELTAERRVLIQRHLDDCHSCIEAFEFEAELRIAISRSCRDTVPESLISRVAQALSIEDSGR